MANELVPSVMLPREVPTSPTAMLLPFLRMLEISGVTLSVIGGGGQREAIASSDQVAARIEELQFELGEGPGFEVAATGCPQQSELGLMSFGGAPFFDAAVRELNVATIITLPLKAGAIIVGVVTLYREEPGLLSEQEMTTAAALVHWVSGPVIERAVSAAERENPDGVLREGKFRREVHQATGMVSVQLGITVNDAFLHLKAHAFAQGETVEAIAHQVVNRRLSFRDLLG